MPTTTSSFDTASKSGLHWQKAGRKVGTPDHLVKIAIVHPYPAKAGVEDTGSAIIYRDRALGTLLKELGHTVKGFRTTEGSGRQVISPDPFLNLTYYPLDGGSPLAPRSRVVSRALIEAVAHWSPEFLLIKGVGTSIGVELMQLLRVPVGAIIGGNHTDRWLAHTEIALTENPEQERYLAPRMGRHRLIRLPKLTSPVFSQAPMPAFEFDIAVIGKFEPHKNHEALRPLFDHDLSIVLVGDGSMRDDLEQYSRGHPAKVTFTGYVGSHDVARILQASRILVHPSRSEGLPRVVVEAMACATPSVCIKGVVGWPLVDGVNSLLVTEDELTRRTLELLGESDMLRRLSDGAVDTFQREFSLESLRRTAMIVDSRMEEVVRSSRTLPFNHQWRLVRYRVVDSPRTSYWGLRRAAAKLRRRIRKMTGW